MSSVAFGALTRKRQEADADRSTDREAPGLKTYVDTLAALVPAEVLLAHAAILSSTTETTRNRAGESVTTITDPTALKWAFWALVVMSVVFYLAGFQKRKFGWQAAVGIVVPPLAFVAWTAAQKATAFDAIWPSTGAGTRDVIVVIGALALGLLASLLPVATNHARAKAKPARR